MKCEKCGNEYPSQYYFATDTICRECYEKMSPAEKDEVKDRLLVFTEESKYEKRASFGKRFAATLIDVIIYAVINMAVLWYMGYFQAAKLMGEEIAAAGRDQEIIKMAVDDFITSQTSTLILGQLIPLLYYSLELFIAASLGKLIMGLRIANEDRTPAETGTLMTRYLVKNLAGIVGLIGLVAGLNFLLFNISPLLIFILFIGYFFILGQKRQGLHDKFSKTAVYLKEDIKTEEFKIA